VFENALKSVSRSIFEKMFTGGKKRMKNKMKGKELNNLIGRINYGN